MCVHVKERECVNMLVYHICVLRGICKRKLADAQMQRWQHTIWVEHTRSGFINKDGGR